MYLLAFLSHLPLHPDNRLNIDSISIIFGPAICAPRGRGISGLGPVPVAARGSDASESEVIAGIVDQSQVVLNWLVRHWPKISKGILQPAVHILSQDSSMNADARSSVRMSRRQGMITESFDPRLLSPHRPTAGVNRRGLALRQISDPLDVQWRSGHRQCP